MPKRNERYMLEQRDMIARAALTVVVEKGLYATSLRDVCKAAGISVGAFYTHFGSTEEAIIAASTLLYQADESLPLFERWETYVAASTAAITEFRNADEDLLKRIRLSFQFAAEISQMKKNPPGLSGVHQLSRKVVHKNLSRFHQDGTITLPLGLARTADVHTQLLAGALYQIASNHDLDATEVAASLRAGLELTAGYTGNT